MSVQMFESMLWRDSNIGVKVIGGTQTTLSEALYISSPQKFWSAGEELSSNL